MAANFVSSQYVQHLLSVYSPINNLFRAGRHLMEVAHYRLFGGQAFKTRREVTTKQIAA